MSKHYLYIFLFVLLPSLTFAAPGTPTPESLKAAADTAFEGLDYGAASKNYHALLAADPAACGAYVRLGLIAENGGDHTQAKAMLDKEPAACPATAESKRLRKMIEAAGRIAGD